LSGQFTLNRNPKNAKNGVAMMNPKDDLALYTASIALWGKALAKEETLFDKIQVAKK
jgi:hypothetical protein